MSFQSAPEAASLVRDRIHLTMQRFMKLSKTGCSTQASLFDPRVRVCRVSSLGELLAL